MNNEFSNKMNIIQQELTDLKTAAEYGSVRSSSTNSPTTVRTGIYRITFASTGEPIMARYYINSESSQWARDSYLRVFPRTPSDNTQEIEVNTTARRNEEITPITYDVNLTILSNRPVQSIERL